MAIPIRVLNTSFTGASGAAQSGAITFSYELSGFQAVINVQITNPNTGNISAGAEVWLYRSTDGGVSYENVQSVALVFPRPTAAQVQRQAFALGPGKYLVAVIVGGGVASSWTAHVLSSEEITAYA